tara:strand:+ start:347 stop:664 length:318 start_codon:yes stop_codon:yes gene_type:complete
MTDIINAILAIDQNAQISVNEEDVNQIIWHDSNPKNITIAQIQTKQIELQAEYDAQEYARNRATEYPALAEQLDLLYHDMTAGKGTKTGEWYKAVKKVKTDNPKG